MLQQGITRRNYFSRIREASYGAGSTLDTYANLEGEMGTPTAEMWSDTQETTGYEEERSKTLLAQGPGAISISGRASAGVTPLLLTYALGGDTVSNPEASAYQHLIAPANLTTDLYTFTHEQHSIGATDATAGSSFKWVGCVVDNFELSCVRKGFVQMSADILTKGDYDTGSSQTEGGMVGPVKYYVMGNTAAWLSTGHLEGSFSVAPPTTANTRVTDLNSSGLLALSSHLREIRYRVANGLLGDEGYGANATDTGVRTQLPRNRRVQTVQLVLDYNTTTAAIQQYHLSASGGNTDFGLEWSCVTGTALGATYYYGWKLIWPQVQIENVTRGGGMGPQTLTIDCTVQADGTNNSVLGYWWNGTAGQYAYTS